MGPTASDSACSSLEPSCRHTVEHIGVKSSADEGTTFTVALPKVPEGSR